MNPKRRVSSLLFATALVFAAGCNKIELYSGLPEKDANEMMALLLQSGVQCSKVAGDEGTWDLTVPESEFASSVATLNRYGYPRESYDNLGGIFKKSGLISSPTEERIRLRYGLAQELGNTISRLDGVQSARVHINLPRDNPFGENVRPSSAAVYMMHAKDVDLKMLEPDIQALMMASIEGLEMENVTIKSGVSNDPFDSAYGSIDPSQAEAVYTEILGVKVARESAKSIWTLLSCVAAVAVVGTFLGRNFLMRPRTATKS